jgi:hypothetical protein
VELMPGKAEDLAKLVRDDFKKWSKVVRDAGVEFE